MVPEDDDAAPRTPRWLAMGCLVLAGGFVYKLPYLRQSYSTAMAEAMEVTHTQLGLLNTIFGILALVCYVPGGWLADRVSARRLLTLSLVTTGAIGLWVAAFPPYPVLFALHALWGISTILTFWAALIKATRLLAAPEEQGRFFGILDGGRGVVEALGGLAALGLFTLFARSADGLAAVMVMYSVACILSGLVVWWVVPEATPSERPRRGGGLQRLREALAHPAVWLAALIVLCTYACQWTTYALPGFATDAFGRSDAHGAALSSLRQWVRPLAAVGAGFLADRLGASRTVIGAFVVLAVGLALLAGMPTTDRSVGLLWANTVIVAAAVFSLRGVSYALLEEGRVPLALTGTAVGMISVLGYMPDTVMPLVEGWLRDTYPGAKGYRILFGGGVGLALVGLLAGILLLAWVRRPGHAATPEPSAADDGAAKPAATDEASSSRDPAAPGTR